MHGFYRIACAVHRTAVANPQSNSDEVVALIREASKGDVGIVVFPELTLTSYTAGDLLFQQTLYESQNQALSAIIETTKTIDTIAIIGIMLLDANRLYNCAAVIQKGKILGIVPKSYLPNNKEFYEKRQFDSGKDIVRLTTDFLDADVPFGVDLLFGDGADLLFGIELCEDLWAVTPPSNHMASNGANLIFNLSASNELVGKAEYRESLVRSQSARAMCAYAYTSSGVGESTTDTVFGGDAMICEYGALLARSARFALNAQLIIADVDLQKLVWMRLAESSFTDARRKNVRIVKIAPLPKLYSINRRFTPYPFVPENRAEQSYRSEEITMIQAHGLIKRMTHTRIQKAVIGISGGLDSTLALLVVHKAFAIMGWDTQEIIAVTMPGFGTTERTKNNAMKLCEALGVTLKDVDIKPICLNEFEAIGHDNASHDVTYENVQARVRTSVLMNMANKHGALVIGTGDLSEIALGWNTYNGDHMSMYALNSGVPKTLIRYLVENFANNEHITDILHDILDTPISPELLPHDKGVITQETESLIGPYELHDFFLYHIIKYGAKPSKVLYLCENAFDGLYDQESIKKWLTVFIKRFFTQQFKRSCMPDGPKVGTISLSPRADWRMPSDADMEVWLTEIEGA